jgi:hypothetical protein
MISEYHSMYLILLLLLLQITNVWCYEDAKGRLQDVVFLNSVSTKPVYPGCSGTEVPTRAPSKEWFVPVNESIVWVETCDGKHEG